MNSFKSRLDRVWANDMFTIDIKFPLPPNKLRVDNIASDEDSDEQLTGL